MAKGRTGLRRALRGAEAPATPRQTLTRITRELVELKGRAGHAVYEMGVRLAQVRDEELWAAGRHANFEEYVEKEVAVSRSTAYKLMRVAREFNAQIAERYGVEKLELGLRYLDHTPAEERPGDLLAADLRVRSGRGRYVSVPFHRASVHEIREAIHLLQESSAAQRRAPASLRKQAEHLEEALPQAPAGASSGRRVRLRRTRDGRVAVTFSAIPVDELEAFLEAVRTHMVK
jgi:hypothetical protein